MEPLAPLLGSTLGSDVGDARYRSWSQIVGRDESPTDERSVPGLDSLERSSAGLLAAEHLQGPGSMTAFQTDHLLPLVEALCHTASRPATMCRKLPPVAGWPGGDRPGIVRLLSGT